MRYVEKKKLPFSSAPLDDRNLPDVHLGLYGDVIVFDHVEKVFYIWPIGYNYFFFGGISLFFAYKVEYLYL